MTATHLLRDRATLAALAGRAPAGAAVAASIAAATRWRSRADEALAIEVVKPDEVQIGLPRGALPDRGRGARRDHEPRRRGDHGAGPGQGARRPPSAGASSLLASAPPPPARWTFVVRFPAGAPAGGAGRAGRPRSHGRDPRRARDDRDPRLRAGGRRRRAGRCARPGAAERRLAAGDDRRRAHDRARCVIPDGAYLLVEGDRPRDHLASVIIALVLMTFGVFNSSPSPVRNEVDDAAHPRHPRGQEGPVRAARARQGRPLRLRHHGLRPLPRRPRAQ